ncbi:NlpC/P60 family protein [Butyrivibrio sp. NC3005]|uniref:NlpC/P60 family protein n=1 Tax=Butyrivibrio sp. NC3005 TaxID=1280685 RepID=UPI00047A1E27|nr:NlpC/P60 family protein [Butyrivibrio sp. NC3005]
MSLKMKKKTYIAVYGAVAVLVLGAAFFQIYSTNNNAAGSMATMDVDTYSSDLVQTIDGTNVDMLAPEFWIRDRGSEVLFSQEEIEDYNSNNPSYVEYYSKEDSRNYKLFMYNLPDSIPGNVVKALMYSGMDEEKDSNLDVDIPDTVIPKYAICIDRSVAKKLPSDEFVSDDEDEIFFNDLISAEVMPFTGVVVLGESRDGEWVYVLDGSYLGWVKKDTLAICTDKKQWSSICQPEDFLVVTGSEIVMDETAVSTNSSGKILPMGTRVKLSKGNGNINGRSSLGAYVVEIPYRGENGYVQMEQTLIPVSKDVHAGFMTMTSESVIRQAFKFLGRVYGYGGSLSSNDCSGFIRQVYSCYGLDLPRNAAAIAQRSDLGSIECSLMTPDKKKSIMADMTPGLLVYMEGHIMMYLGMEKGEPYVISSCATCIEPGHDTEDIVDTFCVFVSGLNLVRTNGNTWLEDINYILWKKY